MSAFVVSYNHINALVKWAAQNYVSAFGGNPIMRIDIAAQPQSVAVILFKENIKSMEFRYSEKQDLAPIVYNPDVQNLKPIEALKLAHCLTYQSCEHDEWSSSIANCICAAITSAAIAKLPGYDAAPWTID